MRLDSTVWFLLLVDLQFFFSFLCWILINPHLPSGPICPYHLDESISNFKVSGVLFLFFIISRIDIPVSKQWRPWSDAAFCGGWSGSALFAYVPKPFLQLIKTQINLCIQAVRSTFLLYFDDWVECKISIAQDSSWQLSRPVGALPRRARPTPEQQAPTHLIKFLSYVLQSEGDRLYRPGHLGALLCLRKVNRFL